MGVVNDSQIPDVIWEKNVIMKHPNTHTLSLRIFWKAPFGHIFRNILLF